VRSLRGAAALFLATLALAAGLVAGCGEPSPTLGGNASKPAPPASLVQSAPTSPVPATPAPTTWPTTTRKAAASHVGYLTAISVGRHFGYDRVVFTFSEGNPGYTVGFVNKVVSDPKGDVVALPGRAFLRIVFHPSSGYQTYNGPSSITPTFPALLQVRTAGDFETYLSFGIGLSQRAGFRVFTLTQPYRVVIDVAHRS
jgi:hypothetical protein